ncbi:head GIN domain-containing protein [Flaviaesturariibacter terrae]
MLPVVLLSLGFSACNKPGCAQKAGVSSRQQRNTGSFAQLVILDNINVVLSEGPCAVAIETDDNLQPVVSAEVRDNQLFLRNNASCSFIRRPGESITAYVTLPHLTRIDYQGSGTVTCADTLHTDYISIEADHGAGTLDLKLSAIFTLAQIDNEVTDLVLAGRSDSCWAWCASRGTIDFRNFQVKRMGLSYAGVRDGYVWATESLHGIIYQTGNVYYRGTPLLAPDYRSSGRLLRF